MLNEKMITHSLNETKVLGLKVARCNVERLDNEMQLLSEIIDQKSDVCRLRVSAEDEGLIQKLDSMGIPFYFSGSIRRYKTRIEKKPEGEPIYPNMSYEMYDGSQDTLLLKMIHGTWGDYPLGYYRTPYLSELITKESEVQGLYSFYKTNNLNSNHADNSIMFMKHDGNYVGFFALNKIENTLESHIGGILEPYRKGGYFLDMLRYIKNFCINNKLDYFAFGARNENSYVQKIFQNQGFTPIGTENVFHILSMLSLSQTECEVRERTSLDIGVVMEEAMRYLSQFYSNYQITKIQHVPRGEQKNGQKISMKFSLPVKSSQCFLAVLTIVCNDMKHTIGYYYIMGDVV